MRVVVIKDAHIGLAIRFGSGDRWKSGLTLIAGPLSHARSGVSGRVGNVDQGWSR
jgi:hypothetical protein